MNCQAKTRTGSATQTQVTHLTFLGPPVALERPKVIMGYRSSKVLFRIWAEREYRVGRKMDMSGGNTGLRNSLETLLT